MESRRIRNPRFQWQLATPNDLKLSHGPRWRGPCMVGGEGGGPEAGAVTARPVGCSAWLGVAVIAKKIARRVTTLQSHE